MPVLDAAQFGWTGQAGAAAANNATDFAFRALQLRRALQGDETEQQWRDFQRQRAEQADAERQASMGADRELDLARYDLMNGGGGGAGGPELLVGLGDVQPQGPVNPLDQLIGAGGAGGATPRAGLPDAFGKASASGRGAYLDAIGHQQGQQQQEAGLLQYQTMLQQAVADKIIDPSSAGAYLQAIRSNPAQGRMIADQINAVRADKVKAETEANFRASTFKAMEPSAARVAALSGTAAQDVAMAVAQYQGGAITASQFNRELADIEERATQPAAYTPDQAAADIRAINPRATTGASQAAARLRMQGNIPVGVGDANFSQAERDPNVRRKVEDRIKVATRRLTEARRKADAAIKKAEEDTSKTGKKNAPAVVSFWNNKTAQLESDLRQAEDELLQIDSGGGLVAGDADTGAVMEPGAEDEQALVDRLTDEGASDEEIAAELLRRRGG